jgi:hypothetical protein
MNLYVVIEGNAWKGFTVHGPFSTREKAQEWGRDHMPIGSWVVMSITEPLT